MYPLEIEKTILKRRVPRDDVHKYLEQAISIREKDEASKALLFSHGNLSDNNESRTRTQLELLK